jgi:hypothetical protein
MKVKKWWSRTELMAFVTDFDQQATTYLATLPVKPRTSEVTALRAQVAELEAKLAEPREVTEPVSPVEKARGRKA